MVEYLCGSHQNTKESPSPDQIDHNGDRLKPETQFSEYRAFSFSFSKKYRIFDILAIPKHKNKTKDGNKRRIKPVSNRIGSPKY